MASRDLRVNIIADTRGYNRAVASASLSTDKLGTRMDRFKQVASTAFKVAGAAAGFYAVKLGKDAVLAAVEAEKSQARLRAQLDALDISFRKHAGEIDRVIQKHSQLSGLDDEDLQDAFTNIIRVTGEVNKSLRLTGLAADFARAKQMDVAKAGELVGKVAGGNIGILARYGVVLKDGATAAEALAELQRRFGGQAEAYGKTAAGSVDRLSVAWENVQERLGQKLLPVLVDVSKWLLRLIGDWENSRGTMGNVRRAIGDTVDAFKWLVEAVKDAAAWVRRAATDMNRWMAEAWRKIKQAFGDAIAFILRRIANLFDVAAKLPFIGDKFKGIADDVRRAADRVDGLGEEIRRLPRRKEVQVMVKTAWEDFLGGGVRPLVPNPGDGWGLETKLDGAANSRARELVQSGRFLPLFQGRGSADLMGAGLHLSPLAQLGAGMGLSVTSGLRPGSVTSSGNLSYHAMGRALDLADGPPAMLAYARVVAARFGSRLKELIHTPLNFSIKDGRVVPPFAQADHIDHVHVAMQRGGVVPGQGSGDKVPVAAMLEPGERFAVLNRNAARIWEAINGLFPRFQRGGVVASAARGAGFSGDLLRTMVAIARAESGWNPSAVGDGGNSIGLWQIYQPAHPWSRGMNLRDPRVNALAAMRVYRSQGLGAWSVYNSGAYRAFLDEAAQAIGGRGRAGSPPGRERASRGRSTTREIVETRQDIRHGFRWDDLQGIRDDETVTPGERRRADRAYLSRAKVLNDRIRQRRRRLRKINRALAGKLRPGTRRRLLQEKQGLVSEIGSVEGELRSLTGEFRELVAPFDTGGDVGGTTDPVGQDAGDLAGEIRALRESIDRQTRFAESVAGLGQATALKAFSDVISGQIGVVAGQRGRSAGDGVTGYRL